MPLSAHLRRGAQIDSAKIAFSVDEVRAARARRLARAGRDARLVGAAARRRRCGAAVVPVDKARWETFLPLHELWRAYVAGLLEGCAGGTAGGEREAARRLGSAELVGAAVTVSACARPSLCGTRGIVARDSARCVALVTRGDELVTVPKKGARFEVEAEALRALHRYADVEFIAVPAPLALTALPSGAVLLLPWLELSGGDQASLGRGLALLQRVPSAVFIVTVLVLVPREMLNVLGELCEIAFLVHDLALVEFLNAIVEDLHELLHIWWHDCIRHTCLPSCGKSIGRFLRALNFVIEIFQRLLAYRSSNGAHLGVQQHLNCR